jgi:hypothetical protein
MVNSCWSIPPGSSSAFSAQRQLVGQLVCEKMASVSVSSSVSFDVGVVITSTPQPRCAKLAPHGQLVLAQFSRLLIRLQCTVALVGQLVSEEMVFTRMRFVSSRLCRSSNREYDFVAALQHRAVIGLTGSRALASGLASGSSSIARLRHANSPAPYCQKTAGGQLIWSFELSSGVASKVVPSGGGH